MDFENTPTPSPTPTPTPTPEPTPTPKKDETVVSGVSFTKDEKKSNEAVVSLVFSKLELADSSKKAFNLEVIKKGDTNPIKVSDLNYDETSKTLSGKLSNLKEGSYSLSKLTLNDNEISLSDELKKVELKVEATNEQNDQPSDPKENDKEAKVKQAQTKLTEATNALTKAQTDLKTAEDELNKLKTDKAKQAKIDAAQTKVNAAKQDVQAKTKAKNDAQAELDELTNSNDKM
ncbi:DUF1410 domain-containing protein [Ureaplasma urealyticum]|uniref:DUF1410 domain-containing protein n=1 Tax=Ureaplasma urealyticum TaxID=2130 RepID=UPI0002E5A786|nr:DUF1410 domain-containing protein [Ureaplasma urealyticum]